MRQDLKYIHKLGSGRTIVLDILRHKNFPQVKSSLDTLEMTQEELNEYVNWRLEIAKDITEQLDIVEVANVAMFGLQTFHED